MKPDIIIPDKRTVSFCGVFCPSCTLYIGTKEEPERLLFLSGRMGKTVEELKYTGCRSDKVSCYCRDCVLKKCAEESGYESCADCSFYPCGDLEKFQKEMPHRAELFNSLEILKTDGFEKWTEKLAYDFSCQKCGIINSAYDIKCRNCGSEPASVFTERHKDEIKTQFNKK